MILFEQLPLEALPELVPEVDCDSVQTQRDHKKDNRCRRGIGMEIITGSGDPIERLDRQNSETLRQPFKRNKRPFAHPNN